MTTNTPETTTLEKCPWCKSDKKDPSFQNSDPWLWGCDTWSDAHEKYRSPLCHALERASKAESELAEVKKALTQLYMATPDCCGGELGAACCLARKYIDLPLPDGNAIENYMIEKYPNIL